MTAALWKRRISVLVALFTLGLFTADAFAQYEPRPRKPGSKRKYKVRIDSAPPGATIYLDDKKYGPVGTTPLETRLQKGTWTVILEKEGYKPASSSMRVRRTRRLQETFLPLEKLPNPPKIEITAVADQKVAGAQVWVDGQLQGTAPLLLKVSEGRHLVELKKEGVEPFQQWVDVKEGEKATLNPVFKAVPQVRKGSILIQADVQGAEIYIDGKLHKDVTPAIITGVIEGPHVIEVRKPPAMPWKQTIQVVDGQTVKVSAELKATMKDPGGSIRVLSNVQGAQVLLDGTPLGPAPIDIKDVTPGEHVVEVKAEGHMPREERVTVAAGSGTVLKLDLQPVASTQSGTLKVVSPVPEAAVIIDGARLGNAPQQHEMPAGEHFVVVTKPGFRDFEQKVVIQAGQEMTVTAVLQEVGSIRVLSTPSGAEVWMDGVAIGTTPFNSEAVEVGPHVIKITLQGFYDFQKELNIAGGQRAIVNSTLEEIPTGPSKQDLAREQRSLSSFGARTLPLGRSTIDIAGGYPYYLNGQVTVGFGRPGNVGLDAGAVVRTFLSRTEFGAKLRFNLYDKKPLSAGFFTGIYGGGSLLDDSQRNTFTLNLGAAASLTAFGMVTVTGRAYLNIWSDRHCPDGMTAGADPIDVCPGGPDLTPDQELRLAELDIDRATLGEREGGVRAMLSGALEIAAWQNWSAWAVFEIAPFQNERAAFTNMFNGPMLAEDIGSYLNLGATYKF